MKLKEIGKLSAGQVISRVEAKTEDVVGQVKILVPKAIKNGTVSHAELAEINLRSMPEENKFTKKGDIVVKLSQPYGAAYISEKDEGILLTSFCLVLRNLKDGINPEYMVTVLNSEMYRRQALETTSGATIPILTKGKIEKMDLNIVEGKQQERIVNFNKMILRKQGIFDEIIRLEKLKLENLIRGE